MKVDIIGGGIIGMSAAFFLSKEGATVRVLERDPSYQMASFARSCGGCRHQFSSMENVKMSRFSIDFIKKVPGVSYVPNGYLMLFGEDMMDDFKESMRLQNAMGSGVALSPSQLVERFPWMKTDGVAAACLTEDGSEGWFDPSSLHAFYRNGAKENGVTFSTCDATADDVSADKIIIASGCWSASVARTFGIDIPVKARKHTVYQVDCVTHIPTMPLVADLTTGAYWRPEGKGYIVGYDGNGEDDASNLDPDWSKWGNVWEAMYNRSEIFGELKELNAWAGYYDVSTLDNNAIIDRVGDVYFATGFTGRGLMHSPAVGLSLSEMIFGKDPTFDLSSYRLNRLPNMEKYVI